MVNEPLSAHGTYPLKATLVKIVKLNDNMNHVY